MRLGKVGSWVRNLPDWVEPLLVLGIAFGFTIYNSTLFVLREPSGSAEFSDAGIYSIVAMELVLGGVAIWFLRLRGVGLGGFGWRISFKGTMGGVGLWLLSLVALWCLGGILWVSGAWESLSQNASLERPAPLVTASIVAILLASIVNPVFEELFVGAYLLSWLRERVGAANAVAAGCLVRASYHTYQGVWGVLGVVIIGLLFGVAYLRWRSLWALILAHGLADLVPLLLLRA